MNLLAQAQSSDWLQRISSVLEQIFGGDTPESALQLYQIAARAIVVYLIGLMIVRIGKSRVVVSSRLASCYPFSRSRGLRWW